MIHLGQWASAVTMLALVALFGMLVGRDTVEATSFNPQATISVADTTPGATSDITTTLKIEAPDSNFGASVGFTPAQWGIPVDTDIPDGAVVGQLTAKATLGIGAGACNTVLTVNFTMIDGTTDTGKTITPTGPPEDPLQNLAEDADGNGIFDAADRYPSYLNEMFGGISPRARQVGWTDPVNGLTVILNFLLFEPGTTIQEADVTPDPRLGFPSVVVLQDPTAAPGASIVGDFCTRLESTSTTFGITRDNLCSPAPGAGNCGEPAQTSTLNRLQAVAGDTGSGEGGHVYRTNPAGGDYTFVGFVRSLYDADDDGHENTLDACPYDPDPDYDPRAFSAASESEVDVFGNPTGDGIPDSCDPDPDEQSPIASTFPDPITLIACPTTGIFDFDSDCFGDRTDNCPLIANGIDANDDIIGLDTQADTDSDGIGDACDRDPIRPDGHRHELCTVLPVSIGAGGGTTFVDIQIEDSVCAQVAVQPTTEGAPTPTATPTDGGGPDTTAPVITCPAGVTNVGTPPIPASDPGIANMLANVSATDNVDPNPTITNDAPSSFPLGVTTVTFTATDASDNSSSCTATVTVTVPETEEGTCKPGETVTLGDGATADSPVGVSVTCPSTDNLIIQTANISVTPPQGFEFLGLQVEISAFDSTADDPWIIVFQLDSSILDGENENTIQTFKDGVLVADCSGASGTASPDPCVSDRALVDGDVEITVLTSTASSWNFGVAKQAVAEVAGGPDTTGAAGGADTGVGSLAPIASSIPAWAAIASGLGGAGLLGGLGALASRVLRRRRQ